jgi:hypothetical protein
MDLETIFLAVKNIYIDGDDVKDESDLTFMDRFQLSIIKKKLKTYTLNGYGLELLSEWQKYIQPMFIYLPGNQKDTQMILLWTTECCVSSLIKEAIIERIIDECVLEFEDLKDVKGTEMEFKADFVKLLFELADKFDYLYDDLRHRKGLTETNDFAIEQLLKVLKNEPEPKNMKL